MPIRWRRNHTDFGGVGTVTEKILFEGARERHTPVTHTTTTRLAFRRSPASDRGREEAYCGFGSVDATQRRSSASLLYYFGIPLT